MQHMVDAVADFGKRTAQAVAARRIDTAPQPAQAMSVATPVGP